QLSRNPVEDPRAVVQEGETHLLRVVSIDQKRQRIGLSLKAVTPTEQIEWMAQKELAEALRMEEEEAAEAARGSSRKDQEQESLAGDVVEAAEMTEMPAAEMEEAVEEAETAAGETEEV